MHLSLHLIRLEQAFLRPGCPICGVRLGAERDWLEIFLCSRSEDPGIGHLLSSSRGFCHHHAWTIGRTEELQGPLALALTYEEIIQQMLGSSAGRPLIRGGEQAELDKLTSVTPGEGCPACLALARSEGIYARVFAREMSNDGFARLYAHADGLCVSHLNLVLANSAASAQASLLAIHRGKLDQAARESDAHAHAPGPTLSGDAETTRRQLSLLYGADPTEPAPGHQPDRVVRCLLCAAERRAEARGVAEIAQGKVRLQGSDGLCARHAWQVYHLVADSHSDGVLAPWLRQRLEMVLAACTAVETALQTEADQPGRPAVNPAERLGLFTGDCIVCSAMQAAATQAIAVLDHQAAAQVCLRHQASSRAMPRTVAGRLAQETAGILPQLQRELAVLIHKSSWEGRHEPKGEEQDSWQRAISLFIGDE